MRNGQTPHQPPSPSTDDPNSVTRGSEAELNTAAQAFFERPAPPDYLSEWARRLAQPEHEAERDLRSLVVFRLHSEWLALSTAQLVEITDPHDIHSIPHRTNNVLLGLVNVRGQLRLCVSLHGLLGVGPGGRDAAAVAKAGLAGGPARTSYTRMIIIEQGHEQWVFSADEVVGVHRLTSTQLRKVPSTYAQANSHTQAVFDLYEHTVGFLDLERLVTSLRSHCQ